MFLFARKKMEMVSKTDALPGRSAAIPTAQTHHVSGRALLDAIPEGMEEAMFGMGCFWGVERMFWKLDGVWLTMVGYAGGYTPNPTYEEVCTAQTGHNEVVRVIYDPAVISYEALLKVFWEGHDPTQGMRQGNAVSLWDLHIWRRAACSRRGQQGGLCTPAFSIGLWRHHHRGRACANLLLC